MYKAKPIKFNKVELRKIATALRWYIQDLDNNYSGMDVWLYLLKKIDKNSLKKQKPIGEYRKDFPSKEYY